MQGQMMPAAEGLHGGSVVDEAFNRLSAKLGRTPAPSPVAFG